MRFEVTQRFEAAIADVADALTDPAYYEPLAQSPKLGAPEVLDRVVDGDQVRLRIRYRFAGDLSSAARAVLDDGRKTTGPRKGPLFVGIEGGVGRLAQERSTAKPASFGTYCTAEGAMLRMIVETA